MTCFLRVSQNKALVLSLEFKIGRKIANDTWGSAFVSRTNSLTLGPPLLDPLQPREVKKP